jgi:methionyl-tRNA formyltransferase
MGGNRIGYGALHVVDAGVDTGAIVHLEEFLFPHACRAPADYFAYAIERYVAFLGELLLKTRTGSVSFAGLAQPEHVSTYWPRLHTETHGWIDWSWEAPALERFICAFDDPYPGARTTWNGTKVHLKSASLHLQDGVFHPYQAGVVYRKAPEWICVAAAGGALIVERVVGTDGATLFDAIKVGDVFFTPHADLEKSRQRIIYTAKGIKGA